MEELVQRYRIKLRGVPTKFKRYLYDEIDWSDRLISLKGSRGVGKTTMLLQYLKSSPEITAKSLYVSLDDIYFQANALLDLAAQFSMDGGKYLFLDEVHKYPNWSTEIKNIYDTYTDLQLVFTSSSLLEIDKGEADLSRRAVKYQLAGLSLREYLAMETGVDFKKYTLEEIIFDHANISDEITKDIKVIPHFKKYIASGYYPFYKENEATYLSKLNSVVSLTIETDIPSVHRTEFKTVHKIKKLLYLIATSLPYQPNISKLTSALETSSRSSTLQYLEYLEKGNLISNLKTSAKGNNYLVKPDKIFLENTNLMYAIGGTNPDLGTLRETFFFNQLKTTNQVNTSKELDFLVNQKYNFELGGKNKSRKQLKGVANSFMVSDNIEFGSTKQIPLWMFGFMY